MLFDRSVRDYGAAYRAAASALPPPSRPLGIPVEHTSPLAAPLAVVAAGSAGAKVRSAARLVGEAAIRSGLWVTQRDDYPVTVKTGHSISELVLSPAPVAPMGGTVPDVAVVSSDDGLRKVRGLLECMEPDGLVVTHPEHSGLTTPAELQVIDPAAAPGRIPRSALTLVLLVVAMRRRRAIPVEALRAAAAGPFAAENLAAVEAGVALA